VAQGVNGLIRNSRRLPQLQRVCEFLGLKPLPPVMLQPQSAWFAGFFDADGHVGMWPNQAGYPQLRIEVTNSFRVDLEPFEITFGGTSYYHKRGAVGSSAYVWRVFHRERVLQFLEYFRSTTFRSFKSKRFLLVPEYFTLRDLGAYRPSSPHHDRWVTLMLR
jgi:hypothetical protein